MIDKKVYMFSAEIQIIGVNPFVFLPENVLQSIFQDANKEKGKIPVKIKVEGNEFIQTLIKYSGHWRLYLNGPMRKVANKEVGDTAEFEIAFDPEERRIRMHPKLIQALEENPAAHKIFESLRPSLQLEIVRYISFLKTEQSIDKNVQRTINFLLGKERFIGRDKP